jgi:hypothetical protein
MNKLSMWSVARFPLLFILTASGAISFAQVVSIKLVDGRTGHPMLNSYVNVWVGPNPQKETMMMIPTDKDGIARLRLTDNDNEVYIHRRNKFPGDSVVNDPIVKYDDKMQVNIGHVICYPHVREYSWLATIDISSKQLLQQGIVWPNACGKVTEEPKPGELVIFVRPLTWWEKLKQ